MSSKPGGTKGKWSASPQGWLLKGVATVYYRQGHRSKEGMGECFRRHFARKDYNAIVEKEVNDNMILQRGHKGTFAKNAFEHPDKHPIGMKLWPYAQKIVTERLKLDRAAIDMMATEAMNNNIPLFISGAPIVPEPNEDSPGGYLYILAEIGCENSAIGIAGNPSKRVRQHSKGNINGELIVYSQLYCENPRKVESYLKGKYVDDKVMSETNRGDEKFRVLPQAMLQSAVNFCNRVRILYREVIDPTQEQQAAE
jgi:hypothetical protein